MKKLLQLFSILCLLPLPAVAEEQVPVPVEKASYHWPVFRNDQVMVLRVHFLPGQTTNFHIHSLDQISVVITGGGNTNEISGQPPGQPKAKGEGEGEGKGEGKGGRKRTKPGRRRVPARAVAPDGRAAVPPGRG
jgi:hypothetical protein